MDFSIWIALIEFIGALLIIGYIFSAIVSLVRNRNVARARLIVADGVLTGLSFKLAGTLLKTIELHSWQQILMFLAILALRIVLKRLFTWEQGHLQRSL